MKNIKEKQAVADIMKRLYDRHLTTCSGGNVSMKRGNGHVFITPSQVDKGNITAEQIIELDADGKLLTPELKASMETAMHLNIYHQRPDVKAVVHAHPPKATAWACSKQELQNNLCGEARFFLGEIARVPYALMGSDVLASHVSGFLGNTNAALLNNHGAMTTGKSLFEAYDRMEVLEYLAELQLAVKQTGAPRFLNGSELSGIDAL
ncbi:MAG: class II aldolase/adducin family protein [Candidatus Delongbacteria bacterium]|jgi:L-fuculose-phosphate aldolase|nr:class II aldolase/adducin family protein [Candidatus Delongbacteria bacterium]